MRIAASTTLKNLRRYQLVGYVFLIPAFFFYTLFVVIPFLRTVYLSFFRTQAFKATDFVGLNNYKTLLTDPLFYQSFRNNVQWAVMAVVIPVSVALLFAVLLARPSLPGRTVFRTLLFLPQVIKSVLVAIIWRWMYNPDFGPVNVLLRSIGLDSIARGWLGDSTWALPALGLAYSWAYYGFCMVILLAALQGIDETQYDAARIDGANAIQQFRYVTFPSIKFALVTVLLFTVIESFKIFDLVFVGTSGGPGYATWVMSIYLYSSVWMRFQLGQGVALAVMQTTWIALLTILLLNWRRRLQEAEG